jgi:PD-(D/E)XK nuclease superfamily
MLRKHTDFDADLEDLVHRGIGCCLTVHRELGAGFELKCVDCLHPVHLAQMRSCLKVSGLRLGLLVNFNVALLQQGIRRVVL